jgi:ankyrin repeat protein
MSIINQIFTSRMRTGICGEYLGDALFREKSPLQRDPNLFSHMIIGVGEIMCSPWRSRTIPRSLSLIQAAQNNNTLIVQALLTKGRVSNLSKGIAFILAMIHGNQNIAQNLLKDDWMTSPCIYRCARHVALQQEQCSTRLIIWAQMERLRFHFLERDLRKGVLLSWNDRVRLAIENHAFSDEEFLKLIWEGYHQGLLNTRTDAWLGDTILILTAKARETQTCIPLMIKLGCNPAIQDSIGNTALIWAIANGNNEIAMTILLYERTEGEARPISYLDIPGYKGNTGLHLAVAKGYKDQTADGRMLRCANLEIVKELIARGADVHRPNLDGNTPLHLACARRDLKMMLSLLLAGARLDLMNQEHKTPRELFEIDFDSACAILNRTVGGPHYYLRRQEFDLAHMQGLCLIQKFSHP